MRMDFVRVMVKGTTWKVRMSNEAIFEFWTPYAIKRKEAVSQLLDIANDGLDIYSRRDVESAWSVAG